MKKFDSNIIWVIIVKWAVILGPLSLVLFGVANETEGAYIETLGPAWVVALAQLWGFLTFIAFLVVCSSWAGMMLAFWTCRRATKKGLRFYYGACMANVLCMGLPEKYPSTCERYGLPSERF